MRVETQFSVFLINKPGVLASITGALAKAHVNIVALALMDSGEHGALRIVCDKADAARKVLSTAHDRWTEAEVLVVELDNTPGAFAAVAQELADEHVNITYAYCTGGAGGGKVTSVFKITEMAKAQKLLEQWGQKKADHSASIRPRPGRR
jgi:hypothetical protein